MKPIIEILYFLHRPCRALKGNFQVSNSDWYFEILSRIIFRVFLRETLNPAPYHWDIFYTIKTAF